MMAAATDSGDLLSQAWYTLAAVEEEAPPATLSLQVAGFKQTHIQAVVQLAFQFSSWPKSKYLNVAAKAVS